MKLTKYLFMIIFLLSLALGFGGCKLKENNNKSLKDHINDAYGNKEFTISFNAQNLDKPLASLKFSARVIPKLPTPDKLGYIFMGWYFDKDYTKPYDDNLLILGMRDVILYAKWQKEEFRQDGIYELSYDTELIKESIVKEELVDKYGGIKDFTKRIIKQNTYIEKTGTELLLKIEYNENAYYPFGKDAPYKINLASSKNDPNLYIKNKIDSLADQVKSLFISLNKVDLSKPIYLEVEARDYESEVINEKDRDKMGAKYLVKFAITKFIGFDKPFVNYKEGLENGTYLLRSYYKSEDNKETMMSQFNPVYGYLKAENGNYKFIKPIAPYYGMIGLLNKLNKPLDANFNHRFMTFTTIQNYYDIAKDNELTDGNIQNQEYLPKYYKAGKYGKFQMEYHSDTKQYYAIFELGKKLDRDLIFSLFVSGFMENNLRYGSLRSKMTLDYDHMVRINDSEYQPLSGDAFSFKKEFMDYPGKSSDLNYTGQTDLYLKKYGLIREFYNYFYSQTQSGNKIHSHRITVTPKQTFNLANGRYQISSFISEQEIFDYDGQANLFADKSKTSNITLTYGLRTKELMKVGKTFNLGDEVDLEELFKNLVGNLDEIKNLTYKEIAKNGDSYDFNNLLAINKTFNFSEEKQIRFEYLKDSQKRISVVKIKAKSDPTIKLKDQFNKPLDTTKVYELGTTVSLPFLKYQYPGEGQKSYTGYYYQNQDGNKIGLDPTSVSLVSLINNHNEYRDVAPETTTFTLVGKKQYVVFDLKNEFGESYLYYVEYKLKGEIKQTITNNLNDTLYDRYLKYNENNQIRALKYEYSQINSIEEFEKEKNKLYFLNNGENHYQYKLKSYYIYDGSKRDEYEVSDTYNLEDIINDIKTKIGSNARVIKLIYQYDKNTLSINYLLNASISGYKTNKIMKYQTYFTNTDYFLNELEILNQQGNYEASITSKLYKYNNGDTLSARPGLFDAEQIGNALKFKFYTPGKYILEMHFSYNFGNIVIKQIFEVEDITSEVSIKYVTDSEHPFKDGSLEKTFKYDLSKAILPPNHLEFITTNDRLIGYKNKFLTLENNKALEDFIKTFNSNKVTLNVIWDKGVDLIVKPNISAPGVSTKTYHIYRDIYSSYSEIFSNIIPKKNPQGYKLIALKADIFPNGYMSIKDLNLDYYFFFKSNLTIELIYAREVIVQYEINSTISNDYFANDILYDGDKIPLKELKFVDPNYEFLGWYVKDDPTESLIDLNTYIVHSDITLIAKFRQK